MNGPLAMVDDTHRTVIGSVAAPRTDRFRLLAGGPFRFGFVAALGVLLALVLGAAVASLSTALTLIFVAFFICLGLYPTVQRLERRGLSRAGAVLIVIAGFIGVVVLLLWLVIPILVDQIGTLFRYLPAGFTDVESQSWFVAANESFGGALTEGLEWITVTATDPTTWVAVGGGALQVGAGLLNQVFGAIFVVALTIYFVAGLESIKAGLYSLVPASRRGRVMDLGEAIMESVGTYLGGMVVLAAMNAAFTLLLLTIARVPFAPVLAALAFPITLIPLVGSVISLAIVTIVSLFAGPQTALVVGLIMVVYVQIEAYVLTPRIVGKAISIPGSLVLIGAMVGGTLLGLLGALIACPTTAAILLIIKKVVVPRQSVA
ncbi:AI-2E family transporter [Microbacterium sp. 179-B 1A2 NHS]|uniref:AI-2E family transporter n=1 Tax=Microbacterium sp. 179-B 1A2 NHS TaxID=3142383 RepID=UPI0039A23469